MSRRVGLVAGVAAAGVGVAACAALYLGPLSQSVAGAGTSAAPSADSTTAASTAASQLTPPVPAPQTSTPAAAPPQRQAAAATTPVRPSQATAYLTVPGAGISHLKIVTYSGEPDNARGTEINDSGLVGAPRGSWGGVAPGEIGNLLLTAHRTSAGAPMLEVPNLRPGAKIFIDQGATRFEYRVSSKTMINFRDASSRALQTAAVPGSPGKTATKPAVVLSTCATPEDNAAGNYWRDVHGNPTHRIAVFGFLQSVTARS